MTLKTSLIAAASLMTATAWLAAGGVPTRVQYVNHQQVAATFARPADHDDDTLIQDERLKVLANRQDPGVPEQHDNKSHIFIIVEGEATLVTGGTMVGSKRMNPVLTEGTDIQGGQSHHLTKGDVISIPARTPHWWKAIPTKTIAYYAINIED